MLVYYYPLIILAFLAHLLGRGCLLGIMRVIQIEYIVRFITGIYGNQIVREDNVTHEIILWGIHLVGIARPDLGNKGKYTR